MTVSKDEGIKTAVTLIWTVVNVQAYVGWTGITENEINFVQSFLKKIKKKKCSFTLYIPGMW